MRTNTGIFKSLNLDSTAEEYANAGFHNSIYREKNITSYLTDGSLWTRISSGKFDDLFVGDYFNVTLNNKTVLMRIAGFDIFYKSGKTPMTTHHVVIIPDAVLTNAAMNSSNSTAGGYASSNMYKTVLPTWVGYLETALGASHVLQTNEALTSSVDANAKNYARPSLTGTANGIDWYTQKVNLLSETEVYGYASCSSCGYENFMANYGQLPLFRLNPQKIVGFNSISSHYGYWLRTIVSSTEFCVVSSYNSIAGTSASTSVMGVRPRFIIG